MKVGESNEDFISDSPAQPLRCLPRVGDQGAVGDSDDLSGEIHLNQLALGGGGEGTEGKGWKGVGDIEGEGRDWRESWEEGTEVDWSTWRTRFVSCGGRADL